MSERRDSARRNWCFTLNNYTDAHELQLQAMVGAPADTLFKYLLYGREVGEQGTPHLQGYFQLHKKMRFSALVRQLELSQLHLEPARGDFDENYAYCTKDSDFIELGIATIEGSNTSGLFEGISACSTWREVLSLEGVSTRLNWAREVWNSRPLPQMEGFQPRPWQQVVIDEIQKVPDTRAIHWVYDHEGNAGKSYLAKYLALNLGAFYFTPARGQDILYGYKGEKVVVLDIPRSCQEFLGGIYGTLEELKNGAFFTGKYMSTTYLRSDPIHVFVFANFLVPPNVFSRDRIRFMDLSSPEPHFNQI